MVDIKIDYNNDLSKFTMRLPIWLNDYAQGMPLRRFSKRRGEWLIPGVRANASYIKEVLDGKASLTERAEEQVQRILSGEVERGAPFPASYRFKTEPMPHQRAALDKLYPLRNGALFMEMGTGKTKVAIDYAAAHILHQNATRVLVVAPLSIRLNWTVEIGTHCPDRLHATTFLLDTQQQKQYGRWLDEDDGRVQWLLVGSESLSNGGAAGLVEQFTRDGGYILLVDESSFFKNHRATRTKKVIGFSEQAVHRLIMTGTPVGNTVIDLYSQFEIVDPAIIGCGNATAFKSRYCVLGGYGDKEIVGYQNVSELIELITPYVAQAKKKDVLKDLPDKLPSQQRMVQMTEEQQKLYKQMKNTFALEYRPPGGQDRPLEIVVLSVLEQMLRLHELAVGILSTEKDTTGKKREFDKRWVSHAKTAEMMKVLGDNAGQSAVIWCTYRMEIAAVAQAIEEEHGPGSVAQLHGGVSAADRYKAVTEFQAGRIRYLAGFPSVGGLGLNMTAAALCVYHSTTWDLVLRMQSEDRIHRKGQTKAVTYVDIVAKNTVDHAILGSLQIKSSFAEFVKSAIARGKNPFELV